MSQNASAISFIRGILKYRASKTYVGDLTAQELSRVWHKINETEMAGDAYALHCGYIDARVLRNAFVRAVSFNPMRFNQSSNYSSSATQIFDSIRDILARFASMWPNGIKGHVYITDTACAQYTLLRDIRDVFKVIARQNMADLKLAEYRDEIVAHFAANMMVRMDANMRMILQRMAQESSARRMHRRDIADTRYRIGVLDAQINLHRANDRQICLEMQAEQDALRHRLARLTGGDVQNAKELSADTGAVFIEPDDAAEREAELLRSLTPEHSVNEIFRQYVDRILTNQR